MTLDEALSRARGHNPYADAYLDALHIAWAKYGVEGARVQLLYILNNLATWCGPVAREAKAAMRAASKEGSRSRKPID